MGSGASAAGSPLVESLQKSSPEDLQAAAAGLSDEQRAKIAEALAATPEEPEEKVELSFLMDELFKCFDADQDGQIEKDEYLACWEKLTEILDESFGPKQRKVKMAWFKDSGAEGSPTDGMYLSREKWQTAWLNTAAETAGCKVEDEAKLASWMWKTYAKKLVEVFFPSAKPEAPAVADVPDGPAPTYPMKIPLTDLDKKLHEAKMWGRRPLVCASGLSEVGTFFQVTYPGDHTMDASDMFLKKKDELKKFLVTGMEYNNLCSALLLKLGSGASDVNKVCSDAFPKEVFDAASWTYAAAFEQGFISEGMKGILDAEPARWKEFVIISYTELNAADAKEKLRDKIPFF